MENNNGVVRTSDLGLSTYLFSVGAKIDSIDRTTPRQAIFTFSLTPEMAEGILGWRSGSVTGNLLAFWSAYQQLKIELYNTGDGARDGAERCRPTA